MERACRALPVRGKGRAHRPRSPPDRRSSFSSSSGRERDERGSSMDTARLPANPSLEQAQKQAKELLQQLRAGDAAALARFRAASPRGDLPECGTLADAQFVIARESGFGTWALLKR